LQLEQRVSELEVQLSGAKDYHMRRMREMKERQAGQLRAARLGKGRKSDPRDQWDAGKEQEMLKTKNEVRASVFLLPSPPHAARSLF
jgi:hypothetical protein